MSLRTRVAGVAGFAVAIAVLLGAVLAYVAIRSELRGEVDTALSQRVAPLARFEPGGPGPDESGSFGGPPEPGEGGGLFQGGRSPLVYRLYDRHTPAFGGGGGEVGVIKPRGGRGPARGCAPAGMPATPPHMAGRQATCSSSVPMATSPGRARRAATCRRASRRS